MGGIRYDRGQMDGAAADWLCYAEKWLMGLFSHVAETCSKVLKASL